MNFTKKYGKLNVKHLQEWDDIRFLMGKSGKKSLMVRIKSFNMSNLSESSALRVGSMLEKYNVKVIHSKSSGVAAFYEWVRFVGILLYLKIYVGKFDCEYDFRIVNLKSLYLYITSTISVDQHRSRKECSFTKR